MHLRLLALSVMSGALFATHPKTDSVKVVNGNAILGEISGLSRGILTFKTDSLGTLSVKWEDVRGVSSQYTFEITLVDGDIVFDALRTDPESTDLLISRGGVEQKVPLRQVVTLVPIETRIWKRFNGAVSLGYSYLKSNTTTQFTTDADLRYVTRKRLVDLSFSGVFVEQQTLTPTRRFVAQLSWREDLKERYFALLFGQYSRNDELQLARRALVGPALGRDLVKTNRTIFSVYGGAAFSRERYYSEEPRSNAEGLFGTQYQFFRLNSPKVDVTAYVNVWPNLVTWGRIRMDSNISSRFELYKDLFFSLSAFDNYDNGTPGQIGAATNDNGVVLSIGYSFNR